jgi:hypothetical protein
MKRQSVAGIAVIGGAAVAVILLTRRCYLRWGATVKESSDPLPGDELIAAPDLSRHAHHRPRPGRPGLAGQPASWDRGGVGSIARLPGEYGRLRPVRWALMNASTSAGPTSAAACPPP